MPWTVPVTVDGVEYPLSFDGDTEPSEFEIGEAVATLFPEGPQDSGQSYTTSLLSSAARGATRIAADIPGGVGYLTGSDTLVQASEDIEAGINEYLPVNPIYQGDFAMKAANAVGQGFSMVGTAGVGGLIGRAVGGVRGAVTAAQTTALGSGFLAGARGGGQAADQYGLEGANAYARILAGGSIEALTERYLFGLGDETRLVSNLAGETIESGFMSGRSLLGGAVDRLGLGVLPRAALTEGTEELVSGVAGNLATTGLAPQGTVTPGAFEGGLENFALGAIAGGAIGGVSLATTPAPSQPTRIDIGGQTLVRAEDGTIYQQVDPATNEGLPFRALQDPLLLAQANQAFYESDARETPGENPDNFLVEVTDALATQNAPALDTQNDLTLPPTETPPPVAPTNVEQAPAPVVEEVPAAPVAQDLDTLPPYPYHLDDPAPVTEVVEQPIVVEETPVAEVAEAPVPVADPVNPETGTITDQNIVPEPVPDFIGISNRRTDEERARLGLPRIYEPIRATFGQWWEAGLQRINKNLNLGSELTAELINSPRILNPEEDAVLAHEKVSRTHVYEKALRDYLGATEETRPAAEEKLSQARARQQEIYQVLDSSGTLVGQALSARKFMVAQDYSLARMDMERRAANANQQTAEQSAETVELYNTIAELQKELDRYQAVENTVDAQAALDELTKEVRTETRKQKAKGKSFLEILEEMAAQAEKGKAKRRGGVNFDLGFRLAQDTAADVVIGAYNIAKGLTNFAAWSSEMLAKLGESVRARLPVLFEQSKAFHDAQKAEFDKPAPRADPRPAMEQVVKNAAEGQPLPPRLVYELFKEKVRAGVVGLTEISQQVTNDLKAVYPDITEREVRDAFSGYGQARKPSQDAILKKVRELRSVAQLASAIEDVQRKIAPLRSGPQRDKATQEVRDMRKKLNRLMKEQGLEVATGPEQLAGVLDGMKSKVRNDIEDLEKQLATGERRQKSKKTPKADAELTELRERRDNLRKVMRELDGPVAQTPEQRIAQSLATKERVKEDLERRINDRDFSKPNVETIWTQELQVLTDEIAALREQYNALRLEVEGQPELTEQQLNDRAVSQLNRAIETLETQLESNDFSRPAGQQATSTPELRELRNKLRTLREQRDAIKGRKEPTRAERLDAAEKALEKTVADLNKKVDENDLSTTPQRESVDNARTRALKAERDSLRNILDTARKEQAALTKDPVAAQLKRDKSSLNRRIKKLQERIATRDFSPPVKRDPVMDAEKARLEIALENAQTEWAKLLFEEGLAHRSPGAKMLDFSAQSLNLARALLTSVDVSAVLRQGGFIVLGNPLRGARNLAPMFKAFASQERADLEMKELQNRDNYPLYKRAKLFLADVNKGSKLSQQEEAFMSRWLDKVPRALGGGILRGSQRAYTVFLNRLRADTFDAMLASLQKGPTPTPAEALAVADYINVATGRGNLGAANQAAVGLNTVFFAPRLVASRFQLLFGRPFFNAPPRVKRLVLREYAKFLTGAAIVYALGSLAQGDDDPPIETDPRSSDFGKIRFGNTRVDPMSGLIQATVLLSRLTSGQKKTAAGKIVDIRGEDVPYGGASSFSVLSDFARSKFSPAFGAAINMLQGRNVVGEETNLQKEAVRMLIPMSISEAAETMQEQGVPKGTALTVLSLLGAGVQTYDPNAKK